MVNRDDMLKENLGSRRIPKLRMAEFPNADDIVRQGLLNAPRSKDAVDIMLVNPPTPDGGLWIRTQHRVGRRTRENMVWPQVSLAQMAALLHPSYKVKVVDANAERMSWLEFTKLLDKYHPRYYLTQVTAPTLENDLYGCFLAHARGAKTIAFGTHVTPIPRETLRAYPSLDFALVGEPAARRRLKSSSINTILSTSLPCTRMAAWICTPSKAWPGVTAVRSSSTSPVPSSRIWTTCPCPCTSSCPS
jgi:hypothetical protein